ncbi:hypothetical protein SRIMM317S_04951 [Streptomyces rimosus subsp. rimosus]
MTSDSTGTRTVQPQAQAWLGRIRGRAAGGGGSGGGRAPGRTGTTFPGTLRRDGSPRLTGIEADFRAGELWLGMMAGSARRWTCGATRASRCTPIRGRARAWRAATYGSPGGPWR